MFVAGTQLGERLPMADLQNMVLFRKLADVFYDRNDDRLAGLKIAISVEHVVDYSKVGSYVREYSSHDQLVKVTFRPHADDVAADPATRLITKAWSFWTIGTT